MTSSSASFRNIRGNTRNDEYLFYHICMCKCSSRQRAIVRISESKDNPNRLYYCCQYANTRDDCHFFKWAFPEGFGDSNTYQEPEEVVQRRMYGVDEDFKHILTRIEFMQKVIVVGLLLFFVLCLKIA